MPRMIALATLVTVAMALAGCGSSGSSTPDSSLPKTDIAVRDAGGTEAAGSDQVVASLVIPAEFTGTPVLLGVSYFASIPPVGMPVAFGDRLTDPAIVAGQDFPVTTTQAGLIGQYYATFVIYCQGGGNGRDPVSGVDWVGMDEQPLTFGPGTGTLDAGKVIMIVQP